MKYHNLEKILKPVYVVPRDNIASDLLIPLMTNADNLCCMAGFFSSSCFSQIAPGLAAFINNSNGIFRFLLSPRIEEQDREGIEKAHVDPKGVLSAAFKKLFFDGMLSDSALARHTVLCLAYLIASRRAEIRIVITKRGMFHPKVWIFNDGEQTIIAHGSSNPTEPGLLYNYETVSLERSWVETGKSKFFCDLFESIWQGNDSTTLTICLPEGLDLISLHENSFNCPTVSDFWKAWHEDTAKGLAPPLPVNFKSLVPYPKAQLKIPNNLQWENGPFAHQGRAVKAWEENRNGILAIATGGGKTIAALVAATRLQSSQGKLFVVISAPYRPLIDQWEQEVRNFNVEPLGLRDLTEDQRLTRFQQAIHSLELGESIVEIAVITNTLLNQQGFRNFLFTIPNDVSTLLIADEVHNLGAPLFTQNPPSRFNFRLGLSATPIRQYDESGTEALLNYFGDVVFNFSLGEAISAKCLTKYFYHIHPVELNNQEFEEWETISAKLAKMGCDSNEDYLPAFDVDELRNLLLFQRRSIIENAESKIKCLDQLLRSSRPSTIKRTLIYTSAKHRSGQVPQIVKVNRVLNDLGIVGRELTYQETGSDEAPKILKGFADGLYQVITCMKVLDEGVDIPQTAKAFLMASSTVLREWVQRRGRILRKAIGKEVAHLHDFLVVPPEVESKTGRAILRRELERAREFASLADNSGSVDGPWDIISKYEAMIT